MPFKIDFVNDAVIEWSLTGDGVTATCVDDYTPTLYIAADDGASEEALADVQDALEMFPTVQETAIERWRTGFRHDAEPALRFVRCVVLIYRVLRLWNPVYWFFPA